MLREYEIVCKKDGASAGELMREFGISARAAARLKRTEGGITVNGVSCRTVDRLCRGDVLRLAFFEEGGGAEPETGIYVNTVYEDSEIIVYDKPSGMPVHRCAGHSRGTLENVFAAHFPDLPFRPVNRLDSDTTGLCVIAKSRLSASWELSDKTYYGVCEGKIDKELVIDAPIGRAEGSVIARRVCTGGKPARTLVTPIESDGAHTLLRIILFTGRTHQIRVHLSHIGFPLAGDVLYGGHGDKISRQALHCRGITVHIPYTGRALRLNSPLPEDIKGIIPAGKIINKE